MVDGVYVIISDDKGIFQIQQYPLDCEMEAHGFADGWEGCSKVFCEPPGFTIEVMDTSLMEPAERQVFLDRIQPFVEDFDEDEDYHCEADE